jgi:alpha-L-rhamnosidase
MCAWVDYVASVAGERRLWDTGFQFGDWLDPTAPPDKPGQARADKSLVASAYFVHSADLVALTAGVLERTAQKKKYLALAAEARAAFVREYVTSSGRLMSDAETAYALALVFDLLPTDEQRQRAGDRLNELVRDSGYRIRTVVGTPSSVMRCAAPVTMWQPSPSMQQDCPSWLSVTMGATTAWSAIACSGWPDNPVI